MTDVLEKPSSDGTNKLKQLPQRLLTMKALNARGISASFVNRGVKAKTFPEPIRIGDRNRRWVEEEIVAFLNQHRGAAEVKPTKPPAPKNAKKRATEK